MTRPPVIVVLAAGSGSRFARRAQQAGHKLEQPFAAATVLASTLAAARESGLALVVVTTPALHALVAAQVPASDIVVLPAVGAADALPIQGMGHSIARAVAARPQAPGWLMLPGDMPLVRAASLCAVAAALREHPIAQARYRGRGGHPVGFRAELYDELVALTGDEGARGLRARHAVHAVEVDDPGVLLDLDTVEDLAALRALHARQSG